jgi:ABC-type sugar transport system ATPase subunit
MVDIEKYFGSVCALRNVNFEVGHNEIVGLIGDNGAGKSTLVKILTGVFPPTSGELFIADQKVDTGSYSVKKAHSLGIETVYQDKSLGEKQAMWRNFFIGREMTFVHKIKDAGKASIYISHNIADVYEISDRFIVIDRGEIVASIAKAKISVKELDEFLLEYSHGLKDKVQP